MGKLLSQADIDTYWSNGFVFPVDVLSESEAASARRRLEDVERRFGPMHYLVKPHLVTKVADELAHHERLLDAAEDLIGPDILVWDSAFIIKEPWDRKHVSWHQDLTYFGLDSTHGVVSIWLALSPVTIENGAMRMIPGSHRLGRIAHRTTVDSANVLSRGQTLDRDVDEGSAVDIALRPGQMSIHHGLAFHASSPNRSGDRRIGFNMNLVQPSVRQVALEADSAMLLRGRDEHGHYAPEPRPESDFCDAAVALQRKTSLMRGKMIPDRHP